MIKRLQRALQFKTISYSRGKEELEAKLDYVNYIRKEFNDLERNSFIELHMINTYSMLYEIKGKMPSLKPYLLAAHFDVVPADADAWDFDPFAATLNDGFIYARGTVDFKSSMISQLEALRLFLAKNGQPERTIYLGFGHDEEIGGQSGAQHIVNFLQNTTQGLEYVLDEGTVVVDDIMPGQPKPSALVGIAEKGYLTVKFSVNRTGGHSSMPDNDNSAIFIMAEAISRLKNKRKPTFLRYGPTKIILESLAVTQGFFQRVLLTNIWLFAPIIELVLNRKPVLDALQRTTTAVTIFNGGVKENVLPAYAEFYVNHRIHNVQSCKEVLEHDLDVINDARINHEVYTCEEPSPISSMDTSGYEVLKHVTMQIYPNAVVQPAVMPAKTDSRHYTNLTNNIYKYFPIQIKNADLKRYHGVNERISVENYENILNFYFLLFKNTDKIHLDLLNNKQANIEL